MSVGGEMVTCNVRSVVLLGGSLATSSFSDL
jgi:hypothetical protein